MCGDKGHDLPNVLQKIWYVVALLVVCAENSVMSVLCHSGVFNNKLVTCGRIGETPFEPLEELCAFFPHHHHPSFPILAPIFL